MSHDFKVTSASPQERSFGLGSKGPLPHRHFVLRVIFAPRLPMNVVQKKMKDHHICLQNTGSAENPITKMFPAAVTERQFLDQLVGLREARAGVDYRDERFTGHTLVDFTILEGEFELPINVKNAGTRFENAASLVGIDPDDCIPIPAHKAYDAIEKEPNLLYAIFGERWRRSRLFR